MCGFAGQFGLKSKVYPIKDMLALISNRGPDDESFFNNDNIYFGFRRLSIIDIDNGKQPMTNEDKTIILMCNGEIYNYKNLRNRLIKQGHIFKTKSDVEVIIHLYEEMGVKCFNELNGMFSVAIYDANSQKMILARDPFGQKPLYYLSIGNAFLFSSEQKVLKAIKGYNFEFNYNSISNYLQKGYIHHPNTIYKNIFKIEPGYYLEIDMNFNIKKNKYFHLNFEDKESSFDKSVNSFRKILSNSVKRHMMSERPVGVFLSGGLDSSSIVQLVSNLNYKNFHTFSFGIKGFIDDELALAKKTSEIFSTIHHEVIMKPSDLIDNFDKMLWHLDEPMSDATTNALFLLSKKASKFVTVVLSGEGADELLCGYKNLYKWKTFFENRKNSRSIINFLKIMPKNISRNLVKICGSHLDYLNYYPQHMSIKNFPLKYVNRKYQRKINIDLNESIFSEFVNTDYHSDQNDGLSLILLNIINYWLPNDLLLKADRMSMAHSIELRSPFLDIELTEFLAKDSLNHKIKIKQNKIVQKYILKEVMKDKLPKEIFHQPKRGFSNPFNNWLVTKCGDIVDSTFKKDYSFIGDLIDKKYRIKILEDAKNGKDSAQNLIYNWFLLDKWIDQ